MTAYAQSLIHSYRVVRTSAPGPSISWRAECTCHQVTSWRADEQAARHDGGDHWRDNHHHR